MTLFHKTTPITLIISILAITTFAQNDTLATDNKTTWLPQGYLFKPLVLDNTECQTQGLLATAWLNSRYTDRLYINTSIGFSKGLVRWSKSNTRYEIRFEAAAFMQFEIENRRRVLGNLFNTDYRASLPLIVQKGKNQYRFRLFHNSSHLGDDFLLRQGINAYLLNKMNFEQIDFTHSYELTRWRFYYGAGFVVTPNARRKRFAGQIGAYYYQPTQAIMRQWFAGFDLKSFQETNFFPNLKVAVGICLGKPELKHIHVVLELYNGHLPYSLFESDQIRWLGLAMYWQMQ